MNTSNSNQNNTTNISSGTPLGTVNTENFEKLKQDFLELKSDFNEQKDKIVSLKNELEKSKFDVITLIGIFVGLITYLGLEIQVFKAINDPLLIIGISVFFISSILLFILSINEVVKQTKPPQWVNFKNPLYTILITLFAISIFSIVIGYKNYRYVNTMPIQIYKFTD
jgi:hypothetical protein